MTQTIEDLLRAPNLEDAQYVTRLVQGLLDKALTAGASDIHFQPSAEGLQLKWRIDGVLHAIGTVPPQIADNVIVKLKVLANLLTYQTQLPQEGRIIQDENSLDVRISTFPTVFGEKAVARLLPSSQGSYCRIGDLGLPQEVADSICSALAQTSGVLLIIGPAGSGKTTTAYACLREILATTSVQRNIVSMEDPVEVVLEQVAQSQVSEQVGFDLTSGLRSLVRQDPDVIFVGEIRDPETARIAFQAALTGQLVITTYHAQDTASALSRLADMGVPSYILRSATNCVIGQQLIRCLCDCATETSETETHSSSNTNLDLGIENWRVPQGCQHCQQSGYQGRRMIAELLNCKSREINTQIQAGIDSHQLRARAIAGGMETLYQQAVDLVREGQTSPAEIVRVFGLPNT